MSNIILHAQGLPREGEPGRRAEPERSEHDSETCVLYETYKETSTQSHHELEVITPIFHVLCSICVGPISCVPPPYVI